MNLNLLINLNNEKSSLIAYYFNKTKNLFEIVDTIEFDTSEEITNSTIINKKELIEKLQKNYQMLQENCMNIPFIDARAILPFQTPFLVLNEYKNEEEFKKIEIYDQLQYTQIKSFKIKNIEKIKNDIYGNKNKLIKVDYFLNKILLDQYLNVFKKIGIKIKNAYTPNLLCPNAFVKTNFTNVLIDINDNKTTFNFYADKQIFFSKTINLGVEQIFLRITKLINANYKIEENINFKEVIKLLKNKKIIKNFNDLSVLVFHGLEQVTIHELFVKQIKNFIKKFLYQFLKEIEEIKIKLDLNEIQNIYVYRNEFLFDFWINEFNNNDKYQISLISNIFNEYENLDPIIECFLNHQNTKYLNNYTENASDQNTNLITNQLIQKNKFFSIKN